MSLVHVGETLDYSREIGIWGKSLGNGGVNRVARGGGVVLASFGREVGGRSDSAILVGAIFVAGGAICEVGETQELKQPPVTVNATTTQPNGSVRCRSKLDRIPLGKFRACLFRLLIA